MKFDRHALGTGIALLIQVRQCLAASIMQVRLVNTDKGNFMRTFIALIVLVVIILVIVGFYRGWFRVSGSSGDHRAQVTMGVHPAKMNADKNKVANDVGNLTSNKSDSNSSSDAKQPAATMPAHQ